MILSKTGALWVIVISISPLSFYLRHRLLNIAVELNRVIGNYNEVARCWNRPNGGYKSDCKSKKLYIPHMGDFKTFTVYYLEQLTIFSS
jgi:hypothetical protein